MDNIIAIFFAHSKLYISRRPILERAILNSTFIKFIINWLIIKHPHLNSNSLVSSIIEDDLSSRAKHVLNNILFKEKINNK